MYCVAMAMQRAIALFTFDGLVSVEHLVAPITLAHDRLRAWPLELVRLEMARVEVAFTMNAMFCDSL